MTKTKPLPHKHLPVAPQNSWADRVRVSDSSTRFALEPLPRQPLAAVDKVQAHVDSTLPASQPSDVQPKAIVSTVMQPKAIVSTAMDKSKANIDLQQADQPNIVAPHEPSTSAQVAPSAAPAQPLLIHQALPFPSLPIPITEPVGHQDLDDCDSSQGSAQGISAEASSGFITQTIPI
ncbi:hypothetical protein POTOM_012966 [Populus tomentosa]|uniref:Uncharacterized protein n=1 Tax=Populus tomentosa TaxID=118781 RepID=A0A8X8D6I0_POPTO|nr:hypothetical protein POTOM_012966 [Populus tomentosa]